MDSTHLDEVRVLAVKAGVGGDCLGLGLLCRHDYLSSDWWFCGVSDSMGHSPVYREAQLTRPGHHRLGPAWWLKAMIPGYTICEKRVGAQMEGFERKDLNRPHLYSTVTMLEAEPKVVSFSNER